MKFKDIVILTDFDGTITLSDVGYKLLTSYADPGWVVAEEEWKQGLIGSAECHLRQFPTISATEELLKDVILETRIDSGFIDFVEFTKKKNILLEVVSDGFDFYIEPVLKKFNFNLRYHANEMVYNQDTNKLELNFPNIKQSCFRCANCKVKVVQKYLEKGKRVIYIGDSYTDYYAAEISDIVFAKHKLKKYCNKKGIDFIPYDTFSDILNHFNNFELDFRYKQVTRRKCSFDIPIEKM